MEFEKLFIESKGQPVYYQDKEIKMIDRIPLNYISASLSLEFISTNSKWTQGIVLQTKGDFVIDGQKLPHKIILWEDTAPKNVEIKINSKNKMLLVYNVWKTEDETINYWHNGGAFFLKKFDSYTEFHCNDGYPDDDFDDLIFKIIIG